MHFENLIFYPVFLDFSVDSKEHKERNHNDLKLIKSFNCFINVLFSREGYASWGLSLSYLQLLFSACVAAIKIAPYYIIVKLYFLDLRDHGVYMYVVYIWKWSSAYALGASVAWHHSLLLMNGFNKTDAAVFSCRLWFLVNNFNNTEAAFPFISLIFYWIIPTIYVFRIKAFLLLQSQSLSSQSQR